MHGLHGDPKTIGLLVNRKLLGEKTMIEETNVLMQDGQPQAVEEILGAEVAGEDGVTEEPSDGELKGTVKKRLGQQEKRHKREIRALQDQVSQMQQFIMQKQSGNQQQPMQDNSEMQQQPQQPMQGQQFYDPHREMDIRRLEDDFNRDIAKTSEKYDDFDDIVSNPRLPFSQSLKEIFHVLDNPGEVIYALGNNIDELYRISQLSQHAQAKEVLKLSKALTMKEKSAPKAQQTAKVMGQLKSNVPGGKEQENSPAYFRKMLRSRGK